MILKNKFMLRAIELSISSANGTGGPFGSVIVKDEKIIAEGSNKVTFSNDPTAHAEIVAIRDACKKLNTLIFQAVIYILVVNHAPCVYLLYIGLMLIIFFMQTTREDAKKINFDDSLIYSEILKKSEDRKIPIKQMLRDEALKAFEIWNKKTDKIEY